jgi:hypothetical protein
MPEVTEVRKFIKSLQTGMTDTTKSLGALFANDSNASEHPLKSDPDFTDEKFKKANVLDSLKDWAKTKFRDNLPSPVSDAKFDLMVQHLDAWPKQAKENVRKSLVDAINRNIAVSFSWELYRGEYEDTPIESLGSGAIAITFRSPRKKLSQPSDNDIVVDV